MLAVAYLFKRTPLGAAMRAVAESGATATLLGHQARSASRGSPGRSAWAWPRSVPRCSCPTIGPGDRRVRRRPVPLVRRHLPRRPDQHVRRGRRRRPGRRARQPGRHVRLREPARHVRVLARDPGPPRPAAGPLRRDEPSRGSDDTTTVLKHLARRAGPRLRRRPRARRPRRPADPGRR